MSWEDHLLQKVSVLIYHFSSFSKWFWLKLSIYISCKKNKTFIDLIEKLQLNYNFVNLEFRPARLKNVLSMNDFLTIKIVASTKNKIYFFMSRFTNLRITEIELKNLKFSYLDEDILLGDVNLKNITFFCNI